MLFTPLLSLETSFPGWFQGIRFKGFTFSEAKGYDVDEEYYPQFHPSWKRGCALLCCYVFKWLGLVCFYYITDGLLGVN